MNDKYAKFLEDNPQLSDEALQGEPLQGEDPPKKKQPITYVKYPIQIELDPRLDHTDALVYWYVSLLDKKDHCTASNEYIAKKLGKHKKVISRSVNKLIKLGYLIKHEKHDERGIEKRVLMINDAALQVRHKWLLDQFNDL
ncbi:MAG TPA: hypothetical protein DCR97_11570 [Deltaproteobacteria bacterium]|nr:hypothetical protein [Deltaproteobacteria bacterium]